MRSLLPLGEEEGLAGVEAPARIISMCSACGRTATYRQTSSNPQYSRAMSMILVRPSKLMVVPQVLRMIKWGATKREDSLGIGVSIC